MFKVNKKHIGIGGFVLAAYSFIFALYFSFQAGCAGDLKTGALGNPSLALQMQNLAFSVLFISLVFGSTAMILRTSGIVKRITNSLGFVIISSILFWLLSWQLEVLGVHSCLKP